MTKLVTVNHSDILNKMQKMDRIDDYQMGNSIGSASILCGMINDNFQSLLLAKYLYCCIDL